MKVYESQRAEYRKSREKSNRCPFCEPKNIKNQVCGSLSGKHWRVLINLYPYMDGNLMIIPHRHIKDPGELNEDEKKEFFEVLENTKKMLGKIFETKEFNVGLNIGKNAGASIDHLHWQIIPRRFKVENASNIFGDIHVITMLPGDLKKIIDNDDK